MSCELKLHCVMVAYKCFSMAFSSGIYRRLNNCGIYIPLPILGQEISFRQETDTENNEELLLTNAPVDYTDVSGNRLTFEK